MQDYKKRAIVMLKAMALIVVLSVGFNSKVNAQAAPLAVTNATPCTVFVSGTVVDPTCVNVCVTAVFPVPPGATVFLPPCSGPMDNWGFISYGLCPAFPLFCPMGIDPNPFLGCPFAPAFIPSCPAYGGVPFAPVWTGPFAVVIV